MQGWGHSSNPNGADSSLIADRKRAASRPKMNARDVDGQYMINEKNFYLPMGWMVWENKDLDMPIN